MPDITLTELAAAIPETEALKDWWEAAEALPAGVEVNEFFQKSLKYASDAARTKNATLSAGSRIDGYPSPTYSATALNTTTGEQTQVVTVSVRSRIPLNLDAATSPVV